MNRRSLLMALAATPVACPAVLRAEARTCCPICGGAVHQLSLLDYKSIPELEARNSDAWNVGASHICSRCLMVYSEMSDVWSQSSGRLDAFHVPLSPPIIAFPRPPDTPNGQGVYQQEFQGLNAKGQIDSVSFWVNDNETYFAQIRRYAAERSAGWRMFLEYYTAPSEPGQTWIKAGARSFHVGDACMAPLRRRERSKGNIETCGVPGQKATVDPVDAK